MPKHKVLFFLTLIYLLALSLRLWFIKDGTFAFGYDQARDAVYAQEILDGNLKIFGPTASGTNDTVFHGVAYYYVLAFLHLFSENPLIVDLLLAVVTSLSIVPIYLLAQYLTKKNSFGLIAALLAAVSYEQIIAGTWLSNPALAVLTLPCFMYFFLKLADHFNYKNMFYCMLFLGLSVQFIFFEIYWLMAPMALFVYQLAINHWRIKSQQLKIWLMGAGIFLLVISSMILAEWIMVTRGILTPQSILTFNTGDAKTPFDHLLAVMRLWVNKASFSMSPRIGLLNLTALFLCLFKFKGKLRLKFFWCLFFTPLCFLLLYYRDNSHLLIAYESLFYVLTVVVLSNFFKKNKEKWLRSVAVFCLILVFSIFNLSGLSNIKHSHNHPNSVQKGFLYNDQVALVQKTFELADGQPFSIATLTNPYNINVTWGYMFDYFGRKLYGYEPSFFGPDQTGLVGADLLERTAKPAALHFAIIEPDIGLDQYYMRQFMLEQQQNAGSISATFNFKQLQLLQFESYAENL